MIKLDQALPAENGGQQQAARPQPCLDPFKNRPRLAKPLEGGVGGDGGKEGPVGGQKSFAVLAEEINRGRRGGNGSGWSSRNGCDESSGSFGGSGRSEGLAGSRRHFVPRLPEHRQGKIEAQQPGGGETPAQQQGVVAGAATQLQDRTFRQPGRQLSGQQLQGLLLDIGMIVVGGGSPVETLPEPGLGVIGWRSCRCRLDKNPLLQKEGVPTLLQHQIISPREPQALRHRRDQIPAPVPTMEPTGPGH